MCGSSADLAQRLFHHTRQLVALYLTYTSSPSARSLALASLRTSPLPRRCLALNLGAPKTPISLHRPKFPFLFFMQRVRSDFVCIAHLERGARLPCLRALHVRATAKCMSVHCMLVPQQSMVAHVAMYGHP